VSRPPAAHALERRLWAIARERPEARRLEDGRTLRLRQGPIGLFIGAFGACDEIAKAYAQAEAGFEGLLAGILGDFARLRRPLGQRPGDETPPVSPVARRMVAACRPYHGVYVTPMAAVAGALADHVLGQLVEGRRLDRAYVNNAGDIALHLAPGTRFEVGGLKGLGVTLAAEGPVRGVATSGRGGASLSFGIADAVTAFGVNGAGADVAATLIANAVDVTDAAIARAPAASLDADSDLGGRLVTAAVGPLSRATISAALDAGEAYAEGLLDSGLVLGAVLQLAGESRIVGEIEVRLKEARV
jgi:ApbE superfamily uncharacterized protein (UPF0280 family)